MNPQLLNLLALAIVDAIPKSDRRLVTARLHLTDGSPPTVEGLQGELGMSLGEMTWNEEAALCRVRSAAFMGGSKRAAALIEFLSAEFACPDPAARALDLARVSSDEPVRPLARALLYFGGATWAGAGQEIARALRGQGTGFADLLMRGVVWPDQLAWELPEAPRVLDRLERARSVRGNLKFSSEKLGRDVHCESGLEKRFYAGLDDIPEILVYQEQPTKVSLPGRRWPYHPDVFVSFTDGRCFVGEVKSDWDMALIETIRKSNALARYCEARGFGLFLGNGAVVVQDLLALEPHPELRNAVLRHVGRGVMTQEHWDDLHSRLRVPILELRSLVLHEKLRFTLNPFGVSRALPEEEREIAMFVERFSRATSSPAPSRRIGRPWEVPGGSLRAVGGP